MDLLLVAMGAASVAAAATDRAATSSTVGDNRLVLPNAPTDLTASSPADGQVKLTWTAPLQPNLTYVIYERKDPATQFNRVREGVTGTTLTFGVLSEGLYEYRVAAVNSAGEGPPSLPASQFVRLPAPASAPANLTAAANNDGTVSLSWQPVNAAGLVNYRVYQRDVTAGESAFSVSNTAVVTGTTAKVSGLTTGDTYEFTVTAFNGTGEGPRSNTARATPIKPPPPAPKNLTATPNQDGTITIAWNSAGPDYWYWVYMRKAGEADFTKLKYPVTTGTTFTAAYLDNGQAYDFRVTTIGTDGQESAPSNIATATAHYAPPPVPTNVLHGHDLADRSVVHHGQLAAVEPGRAAGVHRHDRVRVLRAGRARQHGPAAANVLGVRHAGPSA